MFTRTFSSISIVFLALFAVVGIGNALSASGQSLPAGLYVSSDKGNSVTRYDEAGNYQSPPLYDGPDRAADGGIRLGFGPDGKLYWVQGFTNTVYRYNTTTQVFEAFTSGTTLGDPHGFTFGPDGNLYVVSLNGTVKRFNGTNGVYMNTVLSGLGATTGIAADRSGNLYITNRTANIVYKFDGTNLTTFASGFNSGGIQIGPDENIYICSTPNAIRRYKTDGSPFGAGGDTFSPMFISGGALTTGPEDLAFAPNGDIYVSQYSTNNVFRYDVNGTYLGVFTQLGGILNGSIGLAFKPTTVTVSGIVSLQSSVLGTPQSITFRFHPQTGADIPLTASLNFANGAATFQFNDIPLGQYTLSIKGAKWLKKNITVDARTGSVSDVNVTLLAGDANDDNFVDIADLLLLISHYNQASPNAGYSDAADFNCDGVDDISDLLLLVANYNKQGDS